MTPVAERMDVSLAGETRLLLPAVGWQGYQRAIKLVGDRPIRLTYDRGDLELMSPSQPHEEYGRLLGIMIQALAEELDFPCRGLRSTTWRRKAKDRGIEADECYYLANRERVRGKKTIRLGIDPPPDLAVEIDITSSSLDRLGI